MTRRKKKIHLIARFKNAISKKKGNGFLDYENVALIAWLLVIIIAVLVSSCANITPVVNERETVSYDGNDQTSGIIQDFEDRSSEITPGALERYNDLILSREGFAKYLTKRNFGVTDLPNGNYRITAQAKEYWYALKLEQEGDSIK